MINYYSWLRLFPAIPWGRPNRPNEKNVKKPDVLAGGVRGVGEGQGRESEEK